VAAGAASARARQLDVIADNLANARTPGFRATQTSFQSVLAGTPGSPGVSTVTAAGTMTDRVGVVTVEGAPDLRPGPVETTGEPLDVALDGRALLAVRLDDGSLAYTRAGRLTIDPSGTLLAAGHPVVSRDGAPLGVPPGTVAQLAPDGRLTIAGRTAGRLGMFELDGPVRRSGPMLLQPRDAGAARSVEGSMRVGALEMGNCSMLEAAVQLVSVQRAYDAAMQALQLQNTLDEKAVEVGRVR